MIPYVLAITCSNSKMIDSNSGFDVVEMLDNLFHCIVTKKARIEIYHNDAVVFLQSLWTEIKSAKAGKTKKLTSKT